jgi:hypothetical protein
MFHWFSKTARFSGSNTVLKITIPMKLVEELKCSDILERMYPPGDWGGSYLPNTHLSGDQVRDILAILAKSQNDGP